MTYSFEPISTLNKRPFCYRINSSYINVSALDVNMQHMLSETLGRYTVVGYCEISKDEKAVCEKTRSTERELFGFELSVSESVSFGKNIAFPRHAK